MNPDVLVSASNLPWRTNRAIQPRILFLNEQSESADRIPNPLDTLLHPKNAGSFAVLHDFSFVFRLIRD
jgi:hypothetical protein